MNKNRINHLVRTALLLIMCATWGEASADETYSNGQPYYDSGVWYSLYYHNTDSLTKTTSNFMGWISSTNTNNQPAFALYTPVGSPLAFDYYIDKATGTYDYAGFKVNWGNGDLLYQWATDAASAGALNTWNSKSVANSNTTRTNIKFINNGGTGTNGAGAFINNVKFMLAHHISLTTSSYSIGSVAIGQTGQTTVQFRSFLLEHGKITVKMTSGDPNVFRVMNTPGSEVTVHQFSQNVVCGIAGGTGAYDGSAANHRAGNATSINFIVKYYPSKVGSQSATFSIYDGDATGTALATFTVSGTGGDKSSGDHETDGSQPMYMPEQRGDGNGGTYKWYSLYCNLTSERSIAYNSHVDYDVFTPRSTNPAILMYRNGSYLLPNPAVEIFPDASGSQSYIYYITSTASGAKTAHWAYNIPTGSANAHKIRLKWYATWTCYYGVNYNNLQLELAQHALLNDGTADGTTSMTKTFAHTKIGTPVTCTVNLRSFLTATNLKLRIDNDPRNAFTINAVGTATNIDSHNYTITDCANICGFSGGTGITTLDNPGVSVNTDNLTLTIQYLPRRANTGDTARLVIYDGTTDRAVVTLIASNEKAKFIFEGTQDDNWQIGENWNIKVVPEADDSVLINHNCTIPDGTVGYVDTMTMNYPLTIMPSAMLDAGGISNSASTPITLKADTLHQGTVLLRGGNPYAVVENCFRGTVHPDSMWLNPDWQYRGFIGNSAYLTDWDDIVMFKWNERTNATTCWNDNEVTPIYYRSGSMNGEAWTGYCMANYSAAGNVQSYTTRLMPTKGSAAEYTYTLTRTTADGGSPTAKNCGVNLITNSWSAPIDMTSSAITYGANVQHTFYLFNTRTHSEYLDDSIGSFVVYPSQTGWTTGAPAYIPAGQSFLVRTNNDQESLRIEAGALGAAPSGKMYAPRRDEFNVLRVIINGESSADRLTLVENEGCTSGFDNGYDGTKMMTDGSTQLYAVTSFGNTAVNADVSILGQVIGCVASKEGELCTLRFETDMLRGFDELYLYDRVTGRYVDILGGATYTFYGTTTDESRFQIVGRRDDGSEYVTSSDRKIEVIGERALLSGFSDTALEVYITDIAGNILWSSRASNGPWLNLPDLPAGVYVIYCDGTSTKFIK